MGAIFSGFRFFFHCINSNQFYILRFFRFCNCFFFYQSQLVRFFNCFHFFKLTFYGFKLTFWGFKLTFCGFKLTFCGLNLTFTGFAFHFTSLSAFFYSKMSGIIFLVLCNVRGVVKCMQRCVIIQHTAGNFRSWRGITLRFKIVLGVDLIISRLIFTDDFNAL
uniref:Uncharacterized protein n=1 Tax=Cacopsylla melanoneura TaxID=428564 RepID=A0A8D8ZG48_9HEMI